MTRGCSNTRPIFRCFWWISLWVCLILMQTLKGRNSLRFDSEFWPCVLPWWSFAHKTLSTFWRENRELVYVRGQHLLVCLLKQRVTWLAGARTAVLGLPRPTYDVTFPQQFCAFPRGKGQSASLKTVNLTLDELARLAKFLFSVFVFVCFCFDCSIINSRIILSWGIKQILPSGSVSKMGTLWAHGIV